MESDFRHPAQTFGPTLVLARCLVERQYMIGCVTRFFRRMAYKKLAEESPELVFVYGETGWPSGGSFRPHRTHQNGLSVDFMVPVTKRGHSVPLPTHVLNKWGYAIDFDREGRAEKLQIDFEAIAAHLHALIVAGRSYGVGIELVVFAPDLQEHLFKTERGAALREPLRFNVTPSWVRHDDHYHVDFRLEGADGAGQMIAPDSAPSPD